MVSLEGIRNWAWKISLVSIILNVVALIVPNLIFIDIEKGSYIFWLYNFYISKSGFRFLEFLGEGGTFKFFWVLGYLVAVSTIISTVLMIISTIWNKKGTSDKYIMGWLISGTLSTIMGILGWAVRGFILHLEIRVPFIPLASLLTLTSGIFTLIIGIVSMMEKR
ncbi:MAG: hypothetical protein ACQERB_07725 [Promethearchaeati archaeon]